MAERDDVPARPGDPPKYLPRLKYTPPAPEPEAEVEDPDGIPLGDASIPPKKPASKPAKAESSPSAAPKPPARPRSRSSKSPDTRGNVLIEATPEGETFEGRRRIRIIIGSIAGGIFLLSIFIVWRSIRSTDDTQSDPGIPEIAAGPPPPKKSPAQLRAEAETLLAEARRLEKAGKADDALAKVQAVLDGYSETPSAQVAAAARERFKQGLPLFVDGAAVIATKAEAKGHELPDGGEEPTSGAEVATADVPTSPMPRPLNPGGRKGMVMQPGTTEPPAESVAPPVVPGPPRAEVAARALPPGFRPVERAGLHPSGWPLEIVSERDGGKLVLVPGDRFIQGRDDGKPEERPAHPVQLSTFYVDQHEVTARQFAAFRPGKGNADQRPVVNVSLADARAYAEWVGKSIPTEAQWEMAARATDGRVHPWGNAPPDFGGRRQPKQIDPVMSFPGDQSPYGAFDLAGNAWEWTNDWFDAKFYAQAKGQVLVNPTGPTRPAGRLPEVVIKGGSKDWDASWRSGMRPEAKLPYLGFRCVLNLGEGAPGAQPANAPARPPGPGGTVPF